MREYFRQLAADPYLEGVLIALRGFRGSWAQAEEIRDWIAQLQASGKRVVTYVSETNTLATLSLLPLIPS